MITFLALLIVLGIVVFVHELGHFIAARWAGVRVDVFSVGFGRAIWKWHDRKGTEWRIAWLPLGGFVSIYGQDDMFSRKKYAALSKKKKTGHYLSAPAWKQAIIIAAGVFMNLSLAWVFYTGLFMTKQTVQLPVIGQIEQTTKNLRVGDRIMQVRGKNIESWSDMILRKETSSEKMISVLVLRGEKLVPLQMPTGRWGVLPDANKTKIVEYGFLGAMGRAGEELWTQSKVMFAVIKQMIMGQRSSKDLGGFISIAEMSGRALAAGLAAFITIIALISVNLAVVNLLPLPVLDGGYLFIILLEAVTRRKLQGKGIEWLMRICWGLLIALMAFTLWNDIVRLIK